MLIDQILARMAADSRVRLHRGASEVEVRAAEQSLGLRFPDHYRRFLLHYGWAVVGHEPLFGLGPDAKPDGVNVVAMTLDLRALDFTEWPSSDICIMDAGNGDCYCIRVASQTRVESPVVCWDHELDSRDTVAPSFSVWLARTLDDPDLVPPGPAE